MVKKIMFTVIIFLSVLSVYTDEYGNNKSDKKVLIAYEKSKFKNALVKEVINKLNNGTIYIKTLNHTTQHISDETPADYTAVFITNSGVNSKLRPWINDWLKKHEGSSNIILHTTQKAGWFLKVDPRIDSITSASQKSEVKNLANEIVIKINNLLK